MSSLHPDIDRVAKSLELDLPHLRKAAVLSHKLVKDAQSELQRRFGAERDDVDVVVLGSIARQEATGVSDLDYLCVVHRLPEMPQITREILDAVQGDVREKLGLEEPGAQRIFGVVVSAADLTERIGLEPDTNHTQTQRMLILEESVSVLAPNLHRRLHLALLRRYLADYPAAKKKGVPRFLLNDVLRYWRTLAVDYQAKRWGIRGSDWGLRYLKLVISRKLAFAGTLSSILLCEEAEEESLLAQFGRPPLARLAGLYDALEAGEREDLRTVFSIGEEFQGRLEEADFRTRMKSLTDKSKAMADPEFAEVQQRANQLQEALERIFFDSSRLKGLSRKYLSF